MSPTPTSTLFVEVKRVIFSIREIMYNLILSDLCEKCVFFSDKIFSISSDSNILTPKLVANLFPRNGRLPSLSASEVQ